MRRCVLWVGRVAVDSSQVVFVKCRTLWVRCGDVVVGARVVILVHIEQFVGRTVGVERLSGVECRESVILKGHCELCGGRLVGLWSSCVGWSFVCRCGDFGFCGVVWV